MYFDYIEYEKCFDEDVADNFCLVKRNIDIQITNIKTIIRHNGRSKKQIEDLRILLRQYRILLKKSKKIELHFIDVFALMDEFDGLTEYFEIKLNQMEQIPMLIGLEPFIEMDADDSDFAGTFNYLMN